MSTEEKIVVKVTVSGILGMLKDGKDRAQIGKELGLSGADVKRMFQHPELKGKKVKKVIEPGFIFEDEAIEEEVAKEREEVFEEEQEA